jgi:hypothetical protein
VIKKSLALSFFFRELFPKKNSALFWPSSSHATPVQKFNTLFLSEFYIVQAHSIADHLYWELDIEQ